MKKQVFKKTVFFLFFLLPISSLLLALPPDEILKKYHKEYPANNKTVLTVQNKYGDVNLENWDMDSVAIDVTITVDYPNREKAQRLLGYLEVNFSSTENKINAVTMIDKQFSRLSRGFWSSEKKFSIDYTIHAPAYLNYHLINKYGDAFINELSGQAIIEISYGHIIINKLYRGNLKPLNNIMLAYSKGSIDTAGWLMLDLKYSRLEISKAKAIAGETKYSKLYTDECSSVVLESKYDTYRFGKLNNLILEAGYGNIKVSEVRKKVSLETKYTGVTIDNIPAGFTSIDVDNGYGGIRLGIASGASYLLKGSTSYCKIGYPQSQRVNKIVKNNSWEVNGTIGTHKNTRSTVNIKSRYGSVILTK